MIVKKKVTISRSTGKIIAETIEEEVNMDRETYWNTLAQVIFKSEGFQELLKEAQAQA